MAHYAKLDENNIVLEVNAVYNDQEIQVGEEGIVTWLNENFNNQGVPGGVTWKKTSYNTMSGKYWINEAEIIEGPDQSKAFRKNYAAVGDTYDLTRDAFIRPQPYPSWSLNESSCIWEAPVAYPDDGKIYDWNEDTTSWVEVTN
jgi:hypothetical protein